MKVKVTDEQKVKALLDEVQKKSQVRTLTFEDINYFAKKAEEKLNVIPAKCRKGAVYHAGNCGKFPNAYKYVPYGTLVSLERGNRDWFITACYRGSCNGNNWMNITEEQKKRIAEKAIRNVCHC